MTAQDSLRPMRFEPVAALRFVAAWSKERNSSTPCVINQLALTDRIDEFLTTTVGLSASFDNHARRNIFSPALYGEVRARILRTVTHQMHSAYGRYCTISISMSEGQ
jgi:hypothetical protein